MAGLLLTGAAASSPVAEEVRSRKLVVVDEQGTERASLDDLGLRIADEQGKGQAVIGPDAMLLRTLLWIGDEQGRIVEFNAMGVAFFDGRGKRRARVGVGLRDDAPHLVLFDAQENPRASLSLKGDGAPGLDLLDAQGKARAALGVLPDGVPGLGLADAQGKVRAGLRESSLVLFDKDGKVLWRAP